MVLYTYETRMWLCKYDFHKLCERYKSLFSKYRVPSFSSINFIKNYALHTTGIVPASSPRQTRPILAVFSTCLSFEIVSWEAAIDADCQMLVHRSCNHCFFMIRKITRADVQCFLPIASLRWKSSTRRCTTESICKSMYAFLCKTCKGSTFPCF